MFKEKLRGAFMPFWKSERVSPARVIIFGFLLLILLGTAALMLPFSTRGQGGASFFDALFTATSATCVTGRWSTTRPATGPGSGSWSFCF